jgi:hypothetical protein
MNMSSMSFTANPDPLRRFTTTSLVSRLPVMGRTIRLETNNRAVQNRTHQLFERYGRSPTEGTDFVWRIVTEGRTEPTPSWPAITGFSEEGLRFVSFGQRSFFAIDLNASEAVGFLPEDLANEAEGFASAFLSTLFDMTAAALRLTPIAAACVSLEKKGLLVFGPPTSGKTVSTYLAGEKGLTFHSDQATFLELKADALCAWGQFWPSAFRPDAETFLPELRSSFRPFKYADLTFLSLENPFRAPEAYKVFPVCCVFLRRQAGGLPRLNRLKPLDFADLLKASLPFEEDKRFEAERDVVLRAIAVLPAYELVFGDLRAAASCYRELLTTHRPVEA